MAWSSRTGLGCNRKRQRGDVGAGAAVDVVAVAVAVALVSVGTVATIALAECARRLGEIAARVFSDAPLAQTALSAGMAGVPVGLPGGGRSIERRCLDGGWRGVGWRSQPSSH